MGPATSSVMGAVPEARAGVASAMNDVTRQVAGALGTAVVGSIIASLYASRVAGDTASLAPDAAATAQDSIGGAQAVAAGMAGDAGMALSDGASAAFIEAVGLGLLVAAGCALVAAVVVRRLLPAEERVPGGWGRRRMAP